MTTTSPPIEREIRIEARPETIFPFLTDPEKMVQWIGVKATLEPVAGGLFRIETGGHNAVRGKYVEVNPYTRIVFTWGWEDEGTPLPAGASTVEITLTPIGGGTLLRLTHSGLPEAVRESHVEGWIYCLDRLGKVAIGIDPGPEQSPCSASKAH